MLCSIGLSVLFSGIQVLELYYGQVLFKMFVWKVGICRLCSQTFVTFGYS